MLLHGTDLPALMPSAGHYCDAVAQERDSLWSYRLAAQLTPYTALLNLPAACYEAC